MISKHSFALEGGGALVLQRPVEHRKPVSIQFSEGISRLVDLAIVVVSLPLFLPLCLLAAVAIKLDDPSGRVLFQQTRYGKGGRPFKITKFRTMIANAEALKSRYAALSAEDGASFKAENDPRITRVGRWLRKTYLDELPQFFNVLRNEMAIVGPRANSASPENYQPWQRIRLCVKPGITGSWQISRNKPYLFDDRCLMDLDYIRNKGLWTDLHILFGTVVKLFLRPDGK